MVNLNQPKTVEECLTLQSHFVGISKITEKNYKEFHRRGKTLQALGLGFLKEGRMPTLEEVHEHLNLTTDAQLLEPRKWRGVLQSILEDMTNRVIEVEEGGLVKNISGEEVESIEGNNTDAVTNSTSSNT